MDHPCVVRQGVRFSLLKVATSSESVVFEAFFTNNELRQTVLTKIDELDWVTGVREDKDNRRQVIVYIDRHGISAGHIYGYLVEKAAVVLRAVDQLTSDSIEQVVFPSPRLRRQLVLVSGGNPRSTNRGSGGFINRPANLRR